MAKRGRPTDYRPEYAEQAAKLCELGATDAELADFFNVSTVTIWRWQSAHEEFCKSLRAGKDAADARVERSLYQRAVGYTFDSEKIFHNQGEIVRAPMREHVPPEFGAMKLWLTNRKRDEWSDKQEVDLTGQIETIQRVITDPSPQETDEPGSREDAGHSDSARVPATARRSTV